MKQVILEVNALEMVNFDPRAFKGSMNLIYSVDGQKIKRLVNFDFAKSKESIVKSILNFVKSQGEQEVDEDDFIGSLFVKKMVDEEKVEERLINFFAKISEKVKLMRIDKNHGNYMNMYHEVKGSKIYL